MAQTVYDLGDIAELTVTFTVAGVATDPTTVSCDVLAPDGTSTTYTYAASQIVKDATGVYHLDVTVNQEGEWFYKFVGTGTAADVGSGSFFVSRDETSVASPPLYVPVSAFKASLQVSGNYADPDIFTALSAASRAIEEACGRRFWLDANANQVRYYTAPSCTGGVYPNYYSNSRVIDIDDLTTFTSLTLDFDGDGVYETTWTNGTEFYLDPINAAADLYPFERVVLRPQQGQFFPVWDNAVKVTGKFGWPTVPPQVTEYCSILATQLLLRSRQAPFGVIMAGMELGASARISRFDPDFDRLLGRFAKPAQLFA